MYCVIRVFPGNKKSRPFMWKIHKQTACGVVPYLAGTLLTFFTFALAIL